MLHFKLSVNLAPPEWQCLRLGLIESAALNELHHLLMALHFLLNSGSIAGFSLARSA